jgi:hypothetical protein
MMSCTRITLHAVDQRLDYILTEQGRAGKGRAGRGSIEGVSQLTLSPVETLTYVTGVVSLNPVGLPVGRDDGWAWGEDRG